jgi:DNA-binding MarR family transcriptional regulator
MKRSKAGAGTGARAAKPVDLMGLLHTAYAAQAEVEATLNEIGLSLPKLVALQKLDAAGGSVPLGQLAGRLSCVKSNITQLVDRLEADGLVARESDPKDRRTKLAVLTAAGRKAVTEGTRLQQQSERKLLDALTHAEARQLGTLLEKLGRPRGA